MRNQIISFKSYVKLLLGIIGLVFIPAFFMNAYLEPLEGDLTRTGFFSENEYGWNKKSFRLSEDPKFTGNINERYDVIIIGDSFSDFPSTWSKIFSQLTDLDIGQFNIKKYNDIFNFINILKSNNNLPRILIYESVERDLNVHLNKYNECPLESVPKANNTSVIEYKRQDIAVVPYFRDRDFVVNDLGYALKYIKANLLNKHGKVNQFQLNSSSLFSNKNADEILVFSGDLGTVSWSDEDWSKIQCNALHVQNLLHESGLTTFVLLVAPDKTTVYKKYIEDKNVSGSQLALLASNKELNFLRIDNFLTQKVEQGEKDIYWPNNTHWSFRGHELVAEEMIRYLTEKKLILKVN